MNTVSGKLLIRFRANRGRRSLDKQLREVGSEFGSANEPPRRRIEAFSLASISDLRARFFNLPPSHHPPLSLSLSLFSLSLSLSLSLRRWLSYVEHKTADSPRPRRGGGRTGTREAARNNYGHNSSLSLSLSLFLSLAGNPRAGERSRRNLKGIRIRDFARRRKAPRWGSCLKFTRRRSLARGSLPFEGRKRVRDATTTRCRLQRV